MAGEQPTVLKVEPNISLQPTVKKLRFHVRPIQKSAIAIACTFKSGITIMSSKSRRNALVVGAIVAIHPWNAIATENTRKFVACKTKVHNRGVPPTEFLNELVNWAIQAPNDVFSPNKKKDIYASVSDVLGPWTGLLHRKAVMLEVLRVLGGFESSWNWNAAIDVTNPNSNTPCTEEAGIFQCSADSLAYDISLKNLLMSTAGKTDCDTFRSTIKENHRFAIEYCARLIRFTTNHHGPIKHKHIHPWLSKAAVTEFQSMLS